MYTLVLRVTDSLMGDEYTYSEGLPDWWSMPASSHQLALLAMGLLYSHGWVDDDDCEYTWEVKKV